jgi:hypothetical protein
MFFFNCCMFWLFSRFFKFCYSFQNHYQILWISEEGEFDKYVHLVYVNFCLNCKGFALWLWNVSFSFIFFNICSSIKYPPFCNYIFNYCSTTNQIKNYTYSCNWEFFLQLLITNVKKYKSRVKLQLKVYAMCQHHNNSHYVPLLANLIENCSTNIVKGCCQLHSTIGCTSSTN